MRVCARDSGFSVLVLAPGEHAAQKSYSHGCYILYFGRARIANNELISIFFGYANKTDANNSKPPYSIPRAGAPKGARGVMIKNRLFRIKATPYLLQM